MHFWMNLTRNKPDFESAIKASGYGIIQGVVNPIYKAEDVRSKILGKYIYLEPLAEKNPLNLADIISSKIDTITPLKFQNFGFVFDANDVNIATFFQIKHNFSCLIGAYYASTDWANPKFFMSINAMFEADIDFVFLNQEVMPEIVEQIMRMHDRQLYKTRVICESEDKGADEILASSVHGLLLKDYEYVEFFDKT